MIDIYNDTNIYIISSPNHFTGGTLLLHQLADKLQNIGFKVLMYYIPQQENPMHAEFQKFNLQYTSEIIDNRRNVLIIPEIFPFELLKYQKIRTAFWWLSVDNYARSFKNASKKRQLFNRVMGYHGLYKKALYQLCQSQYALDFLAAKGIQGMMLSDYLHDQFITEKISIPAKHDTVLYNPKKGQEFTQRLIASAPEIEWKPLLDMTPYEVFENMLLSKVYIDFGFHPGKDRIPREAAICGCCIITGKQGAAANDKDVSIPKEYKFDENNLRLIIEKIKEILANYSLHSKRFNQYRTSIKNEKQEFDNQVNLFFNKKY
jgi:hypothetical protein